MKDREGLGTEWSQDQESLKYSFNASIITQRLPEATVLTVYTLCNAGTTQNLLPLMQAEKKQKVRSILTP